MLAGDGFRIRRSAADGPPTGRDVHWSGSVRWWLASVAAVYRRLHPGLSPPLAVERVAPWANTFALVLFATALTVLLAGRFGAAAAALFALGTVAVYPFYQYWTAGTLDHHGLASLCAFAAVTFLAAGGGGWVRAPDPQRIAPADGTLAHWLPPARAARRWFIAAGAAGGAGLWISAATTVPVLAGIGLGASAAAFAAREAPATAPWHAEPALWRAWGVAGCVTSVAFYLLEYFPGHLGVRLEVNHPLYALAWLAGGDLLCRLCQRSPAAGTISAVPSRRAWVPLLGDVALIALPLVVAFAADSSFHIADRFLRALHQDYILEFRSLPSQLAALDHRQLFQGVITLLPLLALPLAALLRAPTGTGPARTATRALSAVLVIAGTAFLHAVLFASLHALLASRGMLPADRTLAALLLHLLCALADGVALAVLFLWQRTSDTLPAPARAVLVLVVVPALALLALAFVQVRWLGTAAALWLAVLVTAAGVLTAAASAVPWTRARRVAATLILAVTLLPFPLFTALFPWRFGYPAAPEITQLVTRDVAFLLRDRLRDRQGVVASGPTTTTWLAWFGGFRGLGTLYWENLPGLRATAAIYGAPDDEQAAALIARHGITHLVILSWDAFTAEYARLTRGQRFDPADPRNGPQDAFIVRLARDRNPPPWLQPVPYALPPVTTLRGAFVRIFEVRRELLADRRRF